MALAHWGSGIGAAYKCAKNPIGQRLFAAAADTQFGHAAVTWKQWIVY